MYYVSNSLWCTLIFVCNSCATRRLQHSRLSVVCHVQTTQCYEINTINQWLMPLPARNYHRSCYPYFMFFPNRERNIGGTSTATFQLWSLQCESHLPICPTCLRPRTISLTCFRARTISLTCSLTCFRARTISLTCSLTCFRPRTISLTCSLTCF